MFINFISRRFFGLHFNQCVHVHVSGKYTVKLAEPDELALVRAEGFLKKMEWAEHYENTEEGKKGGKEK